MPSFERRELYCPRAIRAGRVIEHEGWRLKQYDITIGGAPVPEAAFHDGVTAALAALPLPAITRDRPGVGFIIRHPGREMYYVVVAWWDNQNEMLERVLVRDAAPGSEWRDAKGAYSFCVWDLEVLWHERTAFVRHVLSPESRPDIEAYLSDTHVPRDA